MNLDATRQRYSLNSVEKHGVRSLEKLYQYIRAEGFKGYDPFDGLNSRVFRSIGFFYKRKGLRLAWIQFFKRFPFNLRRIAQIEKGHNPKALALFVQGLLYAYRRTGNSQYLRDAELLVEKTVECRTDTRTDRPWAWGYNFDWQARAFFAPQGIPNIIVTAFVVYALDHYARLTSFDCSEMIYGAADSLLANHLIFESSTEACLSYIPKDSTRVHNVNLWGAAVLALAFSYTNALRYKQVAVKCLNYTCNRQRPSGSWPYGERSHHQFIDGFHTGYNLEAIHLSQCNLQERRYDQAIENGMNYYMDRFFLKDGAPKYFVDSTYPIDIHSCSQALLTLLRVKCDPTQRLLARRVLMWTLNRMQSREGYFYYQRNRWYVNKIPYIRWAQAWMFYAISFYLWDTNRQRNYASEKNSSTRLSDRCVESV
jgi:hypothetical protein